MVIASFSLSLVSEDDVLSHASEYIVYAAWNLKSEGLSIICLTTGSVAVCSVGSVSSSGAFGSSVITLSAHVDGYCNS